MVRGDHGLTRGQVREFRERGYVVLPDVLSKQEIRQFLSAWTTTKLHEKGDQPLLRHKTDSLWQKLVTHERIVAPLHRLLGGTPCVVQSMTAFKRRAMAGQPARNGVALHQDQQYIKTSPSGLAGCWVALNDTDAGNGGFMVVPGSHKAGLRNSRRATDSSFQSHHVIQHMRAPDGKEWVEVVDTLDLDGINPNKVIVLDIPKGAAVFFNGFLVHGSHSNMAPDRERLAVALHYVKHGTWVYRVDLNEVFPTRCPACEPRPRASRAPIGEGRVRAAGKSSRTRETSRC